MKISKPIIFNEKKQTVYQVDVESTGGSETLWYSLPEAYSDLLSDTCDAPLVALLIPAMKNNEDIQVCGMISERLFYNLSGPLQSVLQRIIPSLHKVKIYAQSICQDQQRQASGVATGFSGGVDSFCALADHYYASTTEKFKITHLLFNNVGSHGHGHDSERLFRERYERLLPAANLLGIPFVMINSNMDLFFDRKLGFGQTHTLRNASVALLLQRGIGCYMYASSISYSETFVGPTNKMDYSDAITLPILSTENLDIFSVGSEYTRVEKTLRIAKVSDSHGTLDVCVNANNRNGYTNCSTCFKCLRTLATLEIAGYLEYYSTSFDLKAYKSMRRSYFTALLGSQEPIQQEIVQYAKECNYSFPPSSRIMHAFRIYQINRLSKRVWRKLKYLAQRSV